MTSFTGIWVPIVTPFRDGEIDFPALETLARHLVDGGVAGLVACGSTGEAAALDHGEQLAVLDAVLQAVPDCPVVMGLAGNNMPQLLRRLDDLRRRPISGLLVPPPYYIRPSQAGLLEFYDAIADAASLPVIVYNIPYRTGVAIEFDTLRTLAQHERIVALKDCGGDRISTMRLISETKLQVLSGEDAEVFNTLCLGGCGAIMASAHIRPNLFVRLARLVQDNELDEARRIFYRLLPLIRLLFTEPNPGPLKAALAALGMASDELRSPMQAASMEIRKRLAAELKRLDCL